MRRVVVSTLRRLRRDERGAALLVFTLFLVPLLAVTAVSIDLSRALLIKQKLANAADAAALAVGTEPNLTSEDATTMAQAYIRAHYPDSYFGDVQSFGVVTTATQVDVSITARIPTTFLQVLNMSTMDISVSSQVARAQRKLEVVLALDNTGSMCEPSCAAKFDKLKAAANQLVEVLFGTDSVSDHVKVALVPFSGAVNIGTDKIGSGWLDEAGLSVLQKEDIDLPTGVTLLGLFGKLKNVAWGGCVRARTGPGGYDLTDEPPDPLNVETLWVPYFAPDEPGNGDGPSGSYYNDYINDSSVPGSNAAKQRNYAKYVGATVSNANLSHDPPLGPNFNCVPRPIQPLTNVKSTITAAINAMSAAGSTVIPEGLAWGWRVLSPGAPFSTGAPYSDKSVIKVLILLTDGRNQVEASNGHNHSFYSAYGYAANGHLGNTDGSETRQVLDQKTVALCNNIKADKDGNASTQDVYLYTITFTVDDDATREMMRTCATPPSACPANQCYYDSPTTSSLSGVFTNIAMGINQLRVTR
jgi:Flp pilus assembly protein TadG